MLALRTISDQVYHILIEKKMFLAFGVLLYRVMDVKIEEMRKPYNLYMKIL